jgi:hypothetical protein
MNNKSTADNFLLFGCLASSLDEEIIENLTPNQESEKIEIPYEINSYETNQNTQCLIVLRHSEHIPESILRRFEFELD